MFLTENQQKYTSIIKEEYGIQDNSKLSWMSQYAYNHELFESVASNGGAGTGLIATPLNTIGMGNPHPAYTPSGDPVLGTPGGGFGSQLPGSGDIPMSTLPIALQVAAVTIGLELVPVVPSNSPMAVLSYLDFPYAGGKTGGVGQTGLDGVGDNADNKPIYIKIQGVTRAQTPSLVVGNSTTIFNDANKTYIGKFLGYSRIDGAPIFQTESCKFGVDDISIADVFINPKATYVIGSDTISNSVVRADLVTSAGDHIQGFANFFSGSDDPMSRGENETGLGNTIGARMYTKYVQMGSYEVTGSVTRQQLQDMPIYGVDVVGKVLEFMQNEISQAINNRILDRVFKLGVKNAANQYAYNKVNLSLYMDASAAGGGTPKAMSTFSGASKYVDIDGVNQITDATGVFNGVSINNSVVASSAENLHTVQRRITSRLLAAANLIAVVSRRGRGTWVVTNAQIATALQDSANFVIAPMINSLSQDGSKSLYCAGSIAGLNLYVDPYMDWTDNRICVGRKSNGSEPGVIFMPYILADTVQVTAERTMAPKLLINSRYAIVDAGFWPEQSYYTLLVEADQIV